MQIYYPKRPAGFAYKTPVYDLALCVNYCSVPKAFGIFARHRQKDWNEKPNPVGVYIARGQ
jgi:hypothetical protein